MMSPTANDELWHPLPRQPSLTVDCSAERSASAAPSQARAKRMKKKSAIRTCVHDG